MQGLRNQLVDRFLEAHAIVGSKLGKALWRKQEMAGSTIEPGH